MGIMACRRSKSRDHLWQHRQQCTPKPHCPNCNVKPFVAPPSPQSHRSPTQALCNDCDGRDMVLGLFQDGACLIAGLTTGSQTKSLERLAKCCLVVKLRLLEARRAFLLAGAPIDVLIPFFKAFTSNNTSARL